MTGDRTPIAPGDQTRIIAAVRRLLPSDKPIVVAFDGPSGAGKSTIAATVAQDFDAAIIPCDDFFAAEIPRAVWDTLTPSARAASALDWRRIRTEALEPLLLGCPAQWHAFDFAVGEQPDGTYRMRPDFVERQPAAVILLDGAYSTRPELDDLIDLSVLVDAPIEIRHARLAAREDPQFLSDWHARWDEAEQFYFEHVRPPSSFDMVVCAHSLFEKYLTGWQLTQDGPPLATHSSDLLPVWRNGCPAVLKIAKHPEERRGNSLMAWWNGESAARVLAQDDDAVLLERATGTRSLSAMAENGLDSEASQIICQVAATLHARRSKPLPELVPLSRWFADLAPAASRFGGILAESLAVSRELLAHPHDIVVLHGDLHHANILDAGTRGWLAIDPKGLIGERGFDFANIFCNPNATVAIAPQRLAEQASVVAQAAHLDRRRLLQWILAYAGLSAAWSLSSEHENPYLALAIAHIAAQQLAAANIPNRW